MACNVYSKLTPSPGHYARPYTHQCPCVSAQCSLCVCVLAVGTSARWHTQPSAPPRIDPALAGALRALSSTQCDCLNDLHALPTLPYWCGAIDHPGLCVFILLCKYGGKSIMDEVRLAHVYVCVCIDKHVDRHDPRTRRGAAGIDLAGNVHR